MEVEIVRVREEDKSVLANLVQFYRYDFSSRRGFDLSEHGTYTYRYLDHYFLEDARIAFFLRHEGKLAGFALVRSHDDVHELAEFFVLRLYRRRGFGRSAATQIFKRFPGEWRLSIDENNDEASWFWQAIIPSVASDRNVGTSKNQEFRDQTEFHFTVLP